MRKRLWIIALLCATGTLHAQVNLDGKTVPKDSMYMYICIGHSNMAGRSDYMSIYHTGTPPHERAWNYEIADATNNRITNHTFYPARPPIHHDQDGTYGNDYDECGPALAFVKGLAEAYPQFHFGVMQNAHSGAGFVRDPGGNNAQQYYSSGGLLYSEIISAVQSLAGKVTWGGMMTFIGRAAAGYSPELNNFETNMSGFIDDIRQAAGDPLLPVYAIKYEHNIGTSSQRSAINADMALVAASKPPMHLIETSGTQVMQAGVNALANNSTHYCQDSYDLLAQRMLDTIAAHANEGPPKLPGITSKSSITVMPDSTFQYQVTYVNLTGATVQWIRTPFGSVGGGNTLTGTAPSSPTTDTIIVGVTGNEGGDTMTVTVYVVPFTGVNVNFQLADAGTPPTGYIMDYGLPYGPQATGYTHGWSENITMDFRTRTRGSDFLHNTLTGTNIKRGPIDWDIEVPNGVYDVRVVSGDPHYSATPSSPIQLDVEGETVINISTGWGDNTKRITVADGKLSLTNTPGASATNVVNFMEITFVSGDVGVNDAFPHRSQVGPAIHCVMPNPFAPGSVISYGLPNSQNVLVTLFNQKGQLVRTLVNDRQTPGHYQVRWNGLGDGRQIMPSGTYLLRIESGDMTSKAKLMLVR